MNLEEMKAELESARKSAEDSFKVHLQYLGIVQFLQAKIAAAEKPKTP
jgi:hypothetical protein